MADHWDHFLYGPADDILEEVYTLDLVTQYDDLEQGFPIMLLKGHLPAEFTSNTPALKCDHGDPE